VLSEFPLAGVSCFFFPSGRRGFLSPNRSPGQKKILFKKTVKEFEPFPRPASVFGREFFFFPLLLAPDNLFAKPDKQLRPAGSLAGDPSNIISFTSIAQLQATRLHFRPATFDVSQNLCHSSSAIVYPYLFFSSSPPLETKTKFNLETKSEENSLTSIFRGVPR